VGAMVESRSLILEEEYLIVRHSGELPEIALHSTYYYLCEDDEGPGLALSDEERRFLEDAALERSREIVLRDLDPENRDLGLYRGLKRSAYNWSRHQDFCQRICRHEADFKEVVREALATFLAREVEDVCGGSRRSSINCTVDELLCFAAELDCSPDLFPAGWHQLCCRSQR